MIPRQEHPKPQFEREDWVNLNGKWNFEIDRSNSGFDRGLHQKGKALSGEILVPFCPESKLSGIGDVDFMDAVWYKRIVNIKKADKLVRLHFGAADYITKVYINGVFAGEHTGGYNSFFVDITDFVEDGDNEICVQCIDVIRTYVHPRGKQSHVYKSQGCIYTRTTGIWQTVWIEYVSRNHVESFEFYPDILSGSITVRAILAGKGNFRFKATFEGRDMGEYYLPDAVGEISFNLKLNEKQLWEVGCGRLYDVEMTFDEDKVKTYFGLRQVRIEGNKFYINEKRIFQRLILDQSFYPDGIYTAPDESDIIKDIELSLAAGFNGARMHEKLFEERYLYHADRLGYITWGEFPNWGLDHTREDSLLIMVPEWIEAVKRDFNHPSIILWCPFNETWSISNKKQVDAVIKNIYLITKALDTTRPCLDTSGGLHTVTDVYDTHDYLGDVQKFKERYDVFKEGGEFFDRLVEHTPHYRGLQKYEGQPCIMSEYGGIGYSLSENAWGYGNRANTEEEFLDRFKGLTDALLDNDKFCGFCYTQLTDVEQEQNGLYFYDRTPKFDIQKIKEIVSRKAAYEE